MGMMISKAKQAISSLCTAKKDPKKSPEYLYMSKMANNLKHPRQRNAFYRNPNAYNRLLKLIQLATRFNERTHLLVFKDYLTELEIKIKTQRERPMKLLQILIEKQYYQQVKAIPFTIIDFPSDSQNKLIDAKNNLSTTMAIPDAVDDAPVRLEEYKIDQVQAELPVQNEDDGEVDTLSEHLTSLSLENDEDYDVQPSKRQKTSEEQTKTIDSMTKMEPILFYHIWNAKKELIAMRESATANDCQTHQNQNKRIECL